MLDNSTNTRKSRLGFVTVATREESKITWLRYWRPEKPSLQYTNDPSLHIPTRDRNIQQIFRILEK